jgi:translation initiation factor IF-2
MNRSSPFAKQNERVRGEIETKTYEIVGKLSELDFSADRFDRVSDFQAQPCDRAGQCPYRGGNT